MSNIGSIDISLRMVVDKDTATVCLRIASMYAKQNGCVIALEKGDDGFDYRFKETHDAD